MATSFHSQRIMKHSFTSAPRVAVARRLARSCGARRSSIRAQGESGASGSSAREFGLAPARPQTPFGEMLQYYLRMEPQLFATAVDEQFRRLRADADRREAEADRRRQLPPPAEPGFASGGEAADVDAPATPSAGDLVLYERMQEVAAREMRSQLEDLLYVCILEKFVMLGVDMLPRLDGFVDAPQANLKALTEGIHSKEALELVREHLLGVMGAAATRAFSTDLIKMSKFQMAQVYAASLMFGYWLRRVDRRFQLERQLGTLRDQKEDAVARLERLFAAADDMDAEGALADSAPLDAVYSEPPLESGSGSGIGAVGSSGSETARAQPRGRSALRRYVETFDQAALVDTARIVSVEGAALVERQTSALFGDIKMLTAQMQTAVGGGVSSAEELYARITAAVMADNVETVTMSIGTQRRCVLEAVAFGTFLRDVEDSVQTEWHLLTPMPTPQLPPGGALGGFASGSDDS